MKVRVLATLLWFVTGWSAAGIVVGLMGLPFPVAVLGGVAAGALVWFDPSRRLWARSNAVRRVRPIDEVAAELDDQAAAESAARRRSSKSI